jgi:GNAT superfamily N-acetyltransferase
MRTSETIPTPRGALTIGQAEPGDLPAVVEIVNDAWEWLVAIGVTGQWGVGAYPTDPDHPDLEGWRQKIARGEQYLATREGRALSTLCLSFTDRPRRWMEASDEAGYVSLFATCRAAAGQGVGRALLDWAERFSAAQGKSFLRLGCWAENEKLCAYYEKAGFVPRGEGGEAWRARWFEKPL